METSSSSASIEATEKDVQDYGHLIDDNDVVNAGAMETELEGHDDFFDTKDDAVHGYESSILCLFATKKWIDECLMIVYEVDAKFSEHVSHFCRFCRKSF